MKNETSILARAVVGVFVLALAAARFTVFAQEARPATSVETLPSAREIIDRYLDVTGTRAVIEKTTSRHVVGKISIPKMGIGGAFEQWSTKPDRLTIRANIEGFGEERRGYDGKVAWAIQSAVGATIQNGAELLQTKIQAQYDADLKPDAFYESIKTIGRKNFAGKDCYEVELVAKPLPGMNPDETKAVRTSYEYYEVDTGLMAGTKGTVASFMGPIPASTQMSDYKKFGDTMMATKSTMEQMGNTLEFIVESVEFDTVGDDVFALPKEIQTLVAAAAAKPAPEKQ
jgi:hypothetical protein